MTKRLTAKDVRKMTAIVRDAARFCKCAPCSECRAVDCEIREMNLRLDAIGAPPARRVP